MQKSNGKRNIAIYSAILAVLVGGILAYSYLSNPEYKYKNDPLYCEKDSDCRYASCKDCVGCMPPPENIYQPEFTCNVGCNCTGGDYTATIECKNNKCIVFTKWLSSQARMVRIDSLFNDTLYIMNIGTISMGGEDIAVYIDGKLQTCLWNKDRIKPNEIIQCKFTTTCLKGQIIKVHTIGSSDQTEC